MLAMLLYTVPFLEYSLLKVLRLGYLNDNYTNYIDVCLSFNTNIDTLWMCIFVNVCTWTRWNCQAMAYWSLFDIFFVLGQLSLCLTFLLYFLSLVAICFSFLIFVFNWIIVKNMTLIVKIYTNICGITCKVNHFTSLCYSWLTCK